ncbi:MAG: hypothetical protein WBV55_09635 [Candidatus Sulfotelmatobacter sp.]
MSKHINNLSLLAILIISSLALAAAPARAQSTGHFDGPAELPRTYINSSVADTPAPGKVWRLKEGDSIQQALNRAACGDVIELQPATTFEGSFELPSKSCDDKHWIILRTGSPDSSLPSEGTRIAPCYAGVASLPGRPAFQCASTRNVMARIGGSKHNNKIVSNDAGASHYRFIGLEIADTGENGPDGGFWNLVLLKNADHIVFDRCWIHGSSTGEDVKGIVFEASSYIAIVDSFISDIHSKTSANGADSSAIGSVTGIGPVKVVNNYLEAAGENVLWGGGRADTTLSDIEFRHNYVSKPLIWWQKHPSFFGTRFTVKNLYETKNSIRELIEGNIFENNWAQSQKGTAILLYPKNQYGQCPSCVVRDLTFRYNVIRHTVNGIGIAATDATTCRGESGNGTGHCSFPSGEIAHVDIHDNILEDVNTKTYAPGDCCANGWLWSIATNQDKNWPHDVTIEHNTGFPTGVGVLVTYDGPQAQIEKLIFRNNLVGSGNLGVHAFPPGGGRPTCLGPGGTVAMLERCFDNSWIFTNNVIVQTNDKPMLPGDPYPKTPHCGAAQACEQFFANDWKAVHFVNYRDGVGGDYHLSPSSRYRKAGSDGKDVGADIDAVSEATKNVAP